jgi:hypothetical protein
MLPSFKYHPDPIQTGSVTLSDTVCVCCEQARGYIYTGPVYAIDELNDELCPWCIADGSAHEKFDASFVDSAGIGGYGTWDRVSSDIVEEVAFRTPGFRGWQQERWWTHCGDAAEFIGLAGRSEAGELGPEFLDSIRKDARIEDDRFWEDYLKALHISHGPTAYAFKCRQCGKLGGYSDSH